MVDSIYQHVPRKVSRIVFRTSRPPHQPAESHRIYKTVSLGLYISVPFCRTKCSYCNFASNVFSKAAYEGYVVRLLEDFGGARRVASEFGCNLPDTVDTIFLGGGTPSILDSGQLQRIFAGLGEHFALAAGSEVTVECAPGTLTPALIETLLACGVNRISLGVQSFVDKEAQSVGRLHTRGKVLEEISLLGSAGLCNINLDLIAGLPHQTSDSWKFSLREAIDTGVPHTSVYMLEIDDDSRLGRELIAGGTRYHAHHVPDEEATSDYYLEACDFLEATGIAQYEISNFARPGSESRHNRKYWTRQPYLGFGVDAHSMLLSDSQLSRKTAVRFSQSDSLDGFMNHIPSLSNPVSRQAALEESFFLGLRLNQGIDLERMSAEFGHAQIAAFEPAIAECAATGLLEFHHSRLRLTSRGRLLSNEVFEKFLTGETLETEAQPVDTLNTSLLKG